MHESTPVGKVRCKPFDDGKTFFHNDSSSCGPHPTDKLHCQSPASIRPKTVEPTLSTRRTDEGKEPDELTVAEVKPRWSLTSANTLGTCMFFAETTQRLGD